MTRTRGGVSKVVAVMAMSLLSGITGVSGVSGQAIAAEATPAASHQAAKPQFVLSIPDSTENATFPTRRVAPGAKCGGGSDLSPPLSWRGAPAGTRSFAVMMTDPDGRTGLGVVHWIHYGLPPDRDSLPEGAGSAKPAAVTPGAGGTNSPGTTLYHGPCPPAGEVAHHYVIQVFALDLPADALPAGLTRDALFAAIQGHVLAATSVVQRFGL